MIVDVSRSKEKCKSFRGISSAHCGSNASELMWFSSGFSCLKWVQVSWPLYTHFPDQMKGAGGDVSRFAFKLILFFSFFQFFWGWCSRSESPSLQVGCGYFLSFNTVRKQLYNCGATTQIDGRSTTLYICNTGFFFQVIGA